MPGLSEDVQAFVAAVRSTSDLWASLDVRTIAMNVEGSWHNLITRCVLDARAPESVPPAALPADTKVLACRHEVLSSDRLEEVLKQIIERKLVIGGMPVDFTYHSTYGASPTGYVNSFHQLATTIGSAPETGFRNGHLLRLSGDATGDLFRQASSDRGALDLALQTLANPWDGVNSVARYGLRVDYTLDSSRNATVDFVAPFEIRLEGEQLLSDQLLYRIRAASPRTLNRCSLGVFGRRRDGTIVSETIPIDPELTDVGPDGAVQAGQRQLEGAQWVVLLLRLGGSVVARVPLSAPAIEGENPRLAAYSIFDPGLAWLSQLLSQPQERDADQFHQAVARLFALAGCAVDSYVSDTKLEGRGLVDFVAHAARDRVLFVVECTLGPLATKERKPTRLVSRAQDVQAAVASMSEEVIAVIASARESLPPSEREAAGADGIVVLARGELLQFLERIRAGEPLEGIIRWLRQQVPQRPVNEDQLPFLPR